MRSVEVSKTELFSLVVLFIIVASLGAAAYGLCVVREWCGVAS